MGLQLGDAMALNWGLDFRVGDSCCGALSRQDRFEKVSSITIVGACRYSHAILSARVGCRGNAPRRNIAPGNAGYNEIERQPLNPSCLALIPDAVQHFLCISAVIV